jgi:hypothetical protein
VQLGFRLRQQLDASQVFFTADAADPMLTGNPREVEQWADRLQTEMF